MNDPLCKKKCIFTPYFAQKKDSEFWTNRGESACKNSEFAAIQLYYMLEHFEERDIYIFILPKQNDNQILFDDKQNRLLEVINQNPDVLVNRRVNFLTIPFYKDTNLWNSNLSTIQSNNRPESAEHSFRCNYIFLYCLHLLCGMGYENIIHLESDALCAMKDYEKNYSHYDYLIESETTAGMDEHSSRCDRNFFYQVTRKCLDTTNFLSFLEKNIGAYRSTEALYATFLKDLIKKDSKLGLTFKSIEQDYKNSIFHTVGTSFFVHDFDKHHLKKFIVGNPLENKNHREHVLTLLDRILE